MIEIEKYPCDSLNEALKRERYYIEKLGATLNKHIPTRTNKEREIDNKDELFAYRQKYRLKNQEFIKEKKKAYNLKNKEFIKEKKKAYNLNNQEVIQEKHRNYYHLNKEKIIANHNIKINCDICNCEFRRAGKKKLNMKGQQNIKYFLKNSKTKLNMPY